MICIEVHLTFFVKIRAVFSVNYIQKSHSISTMEAEKYCDNAFNFEQNMNWTLFDREHFLQPFLLTKMMCKVHIN